MSDRDEKRFGILRDSYEAFNRGDFERATELAHPEIEFFRSGNQSSIRGVEALRAWMEPEALEDQRAEKLEFTAAGDKVLASQRILARGAGSGIEIDIPAWLVWTFDDDDRVTRVDVFLSNERADAHEAAGLEGREPE